MKKSWLDVQLCKEGTQDCDGSYNITAGGVLKLPKNSSEEMVLDILFKLIYLILCLMLVFCSNFSKSINYIDTIFFVCLVFFVLPSHGFSQMASALNLVFFHVT